MWQSRRDFQSVWEGGKPASWLSCFPDSVISMACFSHRKLLDKDDMPRPSEPCRTRHEMLIATPRLSMSPLAIYYQSRGTADEKSVDPLAGEIPARDVLKLDSSLKSDHARRTIAAESDTEQTCGR
jgi:hypothetical protein